MVSRRCTRRWWKAEIAPAAVWCVVLLMCFVEGSGAGDGRRRSAPPRGEEWHGGAGVVRMDAAKALRYIAERSGRAVVVGTGVSVEEAWYAEESMATGDLLRVAMSVLASNGWEVADDGVCLRVLPIQFEKKEGEGSGGDGKRGEELVDLQLDGRDISEVAGMLAELTGKTVLAAPRMRGEVSAVVPRPVGREEAIEILYAVLETHGYTVIDYGRYMKIVRSAEAAGKPIPLQRRSAAPRSEEER